MVDAPEVVWHTTTGSVAVTIGPEPLVVEVEVEVAATVVVVAGADVLEVADCLGWVDPFVEAGPDDPQAANNKANAEPAPATPRPANPKRRRHSYASTVRSASTSAKRRCASARRVGMCSVGTSCGVYPFSTRRATVWRCTSSGPS